MNPKKMRTLMTCDGHWLRPAKKRGTKNGISTAPLHHYNFHAKAEKGEGHWTWALTAQLLPLILNPYKRLKKQEIPRKLGTCYAWPWVGLLATEMATTGTPLSRFQEPTVKC